MADAATQYTQPQAYDANGKPIDPEAVTDAAAKGEAFFKQGTRVYARNAKGDLVTIAPEDVSHPGYTVLTPDQVAQAWNQKQYGEGVGNVAKAGAAGLARGATLGASDAILAGIGGDDTRKALKGLREANPITSTVSEVAGAAAPVLLSGGTGAAAEGAEGAGLVSKGIQAAGVLPRAAAGVGGIVERGIARGLESLGYEGTSLAGRVGAGALKMAGAGAAEGAIYGGAQAANDAVLNGDEITAEKIVSGMGHGALFGGAVGGALGAAGPLVTGAANALIPKKEALEQLSREQAGRAAGFKASDYKALVGRARGAAAEERIAATLDDLRNYKIEKGEYAGQNILQPADNAEEILERVRAAKTESAAKLGGLKDSISQGMQETGYQLDRAALAKRIEENVFKPALEGATPSIRRRVMSARKELSALAETDELNALGLENMNYLRSGMRPESLEKARLNFGKDRPVDVTLFPGETPVLQDGRHRLAIAKEMGADSLLANVRTMDSEGNVIAEELRNISVGPKTGPTFRELDQMRSKLREVFQPPPVKGGGLPPPPPKQAIYLEGAEREIASYLKDEASKFLAQAGENPNAYNEANRLYHSFRQLDDVGTKATAHNLGNRMMSPTDHAVGLSSFMGALATGNVGAVGAMAYGAAGSIANKLLRERGNSFVATMAKRAAEQDASIDRVAQVLGGQVDVKAPALSVALQGENLRESYERAANRVRELSTPQVAHQHMSQLMPETVAQYPQLGMAVSTKLLQIYSELKNKLPNNPVDTGVTLTPLAVKPRVSPGQMKIFMSRVKGALEPQKVIADLAHGVIDRDALDMLKVVHPKTFEQLRTRVAEVVERRQDELPVRRRVMLSVLFGFVGDSSLEPARLNELQKTAVDLSNKEVMQDAAAIKPPSNPGRSKLGKSMTLPSQAAFAGET